jgi:transglutaminase-like putative cysteine protease
MWSPRWLHVRSKTLFSLLLFGCSTTRLAPVDLARLPDAKQYPGASAVVLADERELRFWEVDGKPVVDETQRTLTRILTEKGRSSGRFVVGYSQTFEKVLDARCRTTQPDGHSEERARDAMIDDLAVGGSVLFQDQRYLYLDNTAPPGSVIECVSKTRRVRAELFSDRFAFGDRSRPTVLARLTAITPPGWEIEHLATRYWDKQEFAPSVTPTPEGGRRWVFERRDLPRLKREALAPSAEARAETVSIRLTAWSVDGQVQRANRDFAEYARSIDQLAEGTAVPNEAIRAEVQSILADAPPDARLRAERLYAWIQSNIRYVAVEVGLGGWRPHAAVDVYANKYGDCKDKATLLKSMLGVAGIPSHLVEITSHSGFPRKLTLPALGNANHMILGVELPDGLVLADPTTRTVPFGELPLSDQEAEIVIASGPQAGPSKAPSSTAEQNITEIRVDLALTPQGGAAGTLEGTARGARAAELRSGLLGASPKDARAVVGSVFEQKTAALVSTPRLTVEGGGAVTTSAALSLDGVVAPLGARLIRLSSILAPPVRPLSKKERRSPVVLRLRERRSADVRLRLPPGYSVPRLPSPVELKTELGHYSIHWALADSELRIRSELQINERILPVEKAEALRSFFDGVLEASGTPVIVRTEAP